MNRPETHCISEQIAALHSLGIIPTSEALWVYGQDGRPEPNKIVMFDEDGEPKF